jgi:hypothetical protein
MNLDHPHLAPQAAALMNMTDDLRIRAIRTDRWIGFSRAKLALERLQFLCEHPPSTRPPGLAIYAHSGMGKTMLVEKFRRTNPPTVDTVGGAETVPILSISLSSKPSERRVYAQLLSGSGASLRHAMTLVEMEVRALLILKQLKVRVIVIDEVHNLLAGSPREQRVILQLFRHLSNELKASLVFLGIADAREAIAGDTQLSRRLDQMVLPRWKADDEFQSLAIAILRSLPLQRPSVLSAQSLRTLARATDGITAKVFSMLNELAVEAVRSRKEQITDEDVERWKPVLEREAVFA